MENCVVCAMRSKKVEEATRVLLFKGVRTPLCARHAKETNNYFTNLVVKYGGSTEPYQIVDIDQSVGERFKL